MSTAKPIKMSNKHRYALSVDTDQIPKGINFLANTATDKYFLCGNEEYNLNTHLLDDEIVVDDDIKYIDFNIHTDKINVTENNSTDIVHKKYESFIRYFSIKSLHSHFSIFHFILFISLLIICFIIYMALRNKIRMCCAFLKCCFNHA